MMYCGNIFFHVFEMKSIRSDGGIVLCLLRVAKISGGCNVRIGQQQLWSVYKAGATQPAISSRPALSAAQRAEKFRRRQLVPLQLTTSGGEIAFMVTAIPDHRWYDKQSQGLILHDFAVKRFFEIYRTD